MNKENEKKQEPQGLSKVGLFESVICDEEPAYAEVVTRVITSVSKFKREHYMTSVFPPKLISGERCTISGTDGPRFCGFFYDPSVSELRELLQFVCEHAQQLLHRHRGEIEQTKHTVQHEVREKYGEVMYAMLQYRGIFQMKSNPNYTRASFREHVKVDDVYHDDSWESFGSQMCAAGTIYRHFLVPIIDGRIADNGSRGQNQDNQLNALVDIEARLCGCKKSKRRLWTIDGDKLLIQEDQFSDLCTALETVDDIEGYFRLGIQENTEYSKIQRTEKGGATQIFTAVPRCTYDAEVTDLHGAISEKLTQILINAAYEGAYLVGAIAWIRAFVTSFQFEVNGVCSKFSPPVLVVADVTEGLKYTKRHEWVKNALHRASTLIAEHYHIPLEVVFFHQKLDGDMVELPQVHECGDVGKFV